jgi:lipopolysaccharide/colanic/teichoic acid biosynthesis glycosyltransferase
MPNASPAIAAEPPAVAGLTGAGTSSAVRLSPMPPQAVRPLKPNRHLRTLYTQEQTDNAIHRERCRADRTGQPFALVLFRMPRSIGPSRSLLRLARTALTRSRGTDEVGWYDEDTVCALLPDTDGEGANRFADNVAAAFADAAKRPQVTIYAYPGTLSDASPTELKSTAAAIVAGPAVGRRTAAELMPFVSRGVNETLAAHGQLGTGQVAVASLSRRPSSKAKVAAPGSVAHPLTVLLARPMPWWKRAMDVLGAVFGLVAFSPLLLAAAVAIKLTSPGPVFFCQRRAGLGGRPFKIVKFRTMCVNAEAQKQALRAVSEQDGPAFKMKHDPRVTKIGHILRKTSLDELPQLWNVLKGDMSLVGPRPLPIDEQDGAERWQQARIDVTPGLTCIWQIKGRSTVSFAEWVRMDVGYIRKRTIWHDLKILFQTVPAVILRRGAR